MRGQAGWGRRAAAGTLGALVIGLLLASGCRTPPPSPNVAAMVEGEELTYEQFRQYLARNIGQLETELSATVLSQMLDQFLDEQLLLRSAQDAGHTTASAPGTQQPLQAIDALLSATINSQVSDAEVRDYYQKHAEEFSRPERVHLRQILVEDRAAADRALAALRAGEDFATVAERLSIDPSAPYGGDQGELSRADLPPAFADEIFALKPGQFSKILEADYGFHIFQAIEQLPAAVVPLEEVAGEIRHQLHRQRADQALSQLVEEARGRYNVQVYAQNLPFEYRGIYRVSKA